MAERRAWSARTLRCGWGCGGPLGAPNGFSKRFEYRLCLIALHTLYYDFCRTHSSVRCKPAMAAGKDDQLHDLEWIVGLLRN